MRPLAQIFDSLITMCEVPDDWRMANVVPLVRKGCRELPTAEPNISSGKVREENSETQH